MSNAYWLVASCLLGTACASAAVFPSDFLDASLYRTDKDTRTVRNYGTKRVTHACKYPGPDPTDLCMADIDKSDVIGGSLQTKCNHCYSFGHSSATSFCAKDGSNYARVRYMDDKCQQIYPQDEKWFVKKIVVREVGWATRKCHGVRKGCRAEPYRDACSGQGCENGPGLGYSQANRDAVCSFDVWANCSGPPGANENCCTFISGKKSLYVFWRFMDILDDASDGLAPWPSSHSSLLSLKAELQNELAMLNKEIAFRAP